MTPFHQEILSFLKSDTNTDLEHRWIRAFSEREFSYVGCKPHFPKIYRGLPRLYQRENPNFSYVKPHFTNLAAIQALGIDKAVFSLYGNTLLPQRMKIVIFAWVIPDGLGDWVAAQEAARVLDEKIPDLDIQLLFLTPRKLPPSPGYSTHVVPCQTPPCVSDFPLEALRILRNSRLILQIPTFFPGSEELWEAIRLIPSNHPMPLIENIGEYGFLESSWFHPKSANRSMGLHALEKGIFTRSKAPCTFADIGQPLLNSYLFGAERPSKEAISQYKKTHRFFLAYLSTPIGGAIYLHSLLEMLAEEEKDIDLCCPDLKWLIDWISQRQKLSLPPIQGEFGLKEVAIVSSDQTHLRRLRETAKLSASSIPGRFLYLICVSSFF